MVAHSSIIPKLPFLLDSSTRALDRLIADERVRYASERVDFHDFFEHTTVPQVQKILRRELRSDDFESSRPHVVETLFYAQQVSPHLLWTLLLIQACATQLTKRRRSFSLGVDARLDELVVQTFVNAVTELPIWLEGAEIQRHALRASANGLSRALRAERVPRRRTKPATRAARLRSVPLNPSTTKPDVA